MNEGIGNIGPRRKGVKFVRTPLVEEMQAFDKLPPAARHALAHAPVKISAAQCYEEYLRSNRSTRYVVDLVAGTVRHAVRR